MKKQDKRVILMDTATMEEVVNLARWGVSTQEISRRTGISKGQVSYRIRTHKDVTGLEQGLRASWRQGNNPLLDQVMADHRDVMRLEWERKFLAKVIIPKQPEMVKVK